ncbi:MAG: adenylate/guanylate cyclase domain-containing protein [SAR324 cluster bacterium]|nr:adenylate/guanylate cyclase domain-containing protein [SAR324 cluster bacterium]
MNFFLPGVAVVHIYLSLSRVIRLASFRGFKSHEWFQLIAGILTVPALALHVSGTKIAHVFYGINDTYTFLSSSIADYTDIVIFNLLMLLVWMHGYIGVKYWMKVNSKYQSYQNKMGMFFFLLPILSFVGVISMFREANLNLLIDPKYKEKVFNSSNPENADLDKLTEDTIMYFVIPYLFLIILLFTSRFIFFKIKRRNNSIQINYPEGIISKIFPGMSILEASIDAGIPHAHVCGGRGRCSTCRIRVDKGLDQLEPPRQKERRVLRGIGAPENVRLACQAFPKIDLNVSPLLAHDANYKENASEQKYIHGSDREICIMFTDLRAFTKMSEKKLPYDVVFILNQYFKLMGEIIENHGGYLDKFIGDGTMALFGIEEGPKEGSRNAIMAASQMNVELKKLNERLIHDLPFPLKMGIGIHSGDVIFGKMGYKHAKNLTAVGDAVNTASRLESLTKEFKCQLIISKYTYELSDYKFNTIEEDSVKIIGRDEMLDVVKIENTSMV